MLLYFTSDAMSESFLVAAPLIVSVLAIVWIIWMVRDT